MKKLLSVILVIVMLATAVPVALGAEECKHVFDEETLVRPAFADNVYVPGSFVCTECGESVEADFADFTEFVEAYSAIFAFAANYYYQEEAMESVPVFSDELMSVMYEEYKNVPVYYLTEYEQNTVDEITEKLKVIATQIEAFNVDNGYETILDFTEISLAETRVAILEIYSYYPENFALKEEVEKEISDEMGKWDVRLEEIYKEMAPYGGISGAPEELKAEVQAYYDFNAEYMNTMIDCLYLNKHDVKAFVDCGNGEHTGDCNFCTAVNITEAHAFSEYIENGDGTKTAKCACCDAEDTVTVEISDDDEEDNNESITEEEPFENLSFFEKLIELLKDLFELLKSFFESIFS